MICWNTSFATTTTVLGVKGDVSLDQEGKITKANHFSVVALEIGRPLRR